MEKLSVKQLIAFRQKSERAKKTFVANLKKGKANSESDGGGDYWITSLSAISNSYKENDIGFIKDKIEELEEKRDSEENKRTKIMYQRNIDILYNYEDFNFNIWRPARKLQLLKKPKSISIFNIKGLQIQSLPHHVFSFERNGEKEIGAIWFVTQLKGYKKEEMGLFSEVLYMYLKTNYKRGYMLSEKYCLAVDVASQLSVSFSLIKSSQVSSILNSTLDDIKKLI